MIDLFNATTNQLLGSITEADLKVLVDALEEEGVNDQDYYIDKATIDVIADGRATEHLVRLLRSALASGDGVVPSSSRVSPRSRSNTRTAAAGLPRRAAACMSRM